jgi:uncharacterized protein with HEPN domain
MSRDYKIFLQDILEAIKKIEKYTGDMGFDDFVKQEIVVDAVVRNLEIIGEAAKNTPTSVRTKHKDIEWKKIAGLRDILIHEYFGVDLYILWDIVSRKMPDLKKKIASILS